MCLCAGKVFQEVEYATALVVPPPPPKQYIEKRQRCGTFAKLMFGTGPTSGSASIPNSHGESHWGQRSQNAGAWSWTFSVKKVPLVDEVKYIQLPLIRQMHPPQRKQIREINMLFFFLIFCASIRRNRPPNRSRCQRRAFQCQWCRRRNRY